MEGKMKKNKIIKWIIGIVLIVYMLHQLYVSISFILFLSEFSSNIEEITAPYKIYEQQENSIERLLTDKEYEVLAVSMFNYTTDSPFYEWYDIERNITCENLDEPCYTNDVAVNIEMKSFGSKSDQVWDALISSNVVYPNAFVHWITIKSPIDKCEWTIFGMWKWGFTEDSKELVDIQQLIQKQIDEYGKCS